MFFEKDPFLKKWERNLAEKPKRIFSEKQKTLPSCSFGLLAFFVCLGGQFMLLPHRKAETTQLFSQREIVSVGVGGERGFFTGAAVGLLYMIAGYALYCLLAQAGCSLSAQEK